MANGSKPVIFAYDTIDEYQIEITSYCNAACPQCPRNINGGKINPYMPLCHLERSVIDDAFDDALCLRLRQIFFCGSYGDPIMHPDFLNILRDFRKKNPTLWLYFHTNGGVHEPEYWAEIASIMAGYGQIDFGIDGIGDVLSIYRQNVQYDKVISNAEAFIKAGGRAQWNFIVFAHNEHQLAHAQTLAKDLGFYAFLPRKTGRFFHHGQERELDQWPVNDKQNNTIYWIKPPTDPEWRNDSLQRLPHLKKEAGNLDQYFASTPIRCDALLGRKVTISAEGLVMPCNFFIHNLYDARFREDVLPGQNRRHLTATGNQVREFLAQYGFDSLDIHYTTLSQIFQSPMWQDLIESWSNDKRLFECAMTCGEKFTKVWDQGGSQR